MDGHKSSCLVEKNGEQAIPPLDRHQHPPPSNSYSFHQAKDRESKEKLIKITLFFAYKNKLQKI